MKEAIFHIQELRKEYENRCVLHVGLLDIFRGEIFAVIGPSGAGKSTLLRLMNFLEEPTAGTLHYKSNEFSADKDMPLALRRQVTSVFQNPLLLNRSVWANVKFGLHIRGIKNSNPKIENAIAQVGLSDLSQQRARNLSGGEAQRVALARALVIQPEVLLLDEPTANLDPYNVDLIERIVQGINHKKQTTIVIVTHNVFQTRRLAHRAAFMLNGEMVEVADVKKIFEQPEDSRTAAFVRGEMVY